MPLAEEAPGFMHPEASVADKIRALAAAGYSRAEIARLLNKRYQHVRNVLEGDKLKGASAPRPRGAVPPEPRTVRLGDSFRVSVGRDGLIRLPPEAMEAFGLREGAAMVAQLEGETFTLVSPRESLRRARALIPQWRPGDPLWSEELIAERHREAAREEEE